MGGWLFKTRSQAFFQQEEFPLVNESEDVARRDARASNHGYKFIDIGGELVEHLASIAMG